MDIRSVQTDAWTAPWTAAGTEGAAVMRRVEYAAQGEKYGGAHVRSRGYTTLTARTRTLPLRGPRAPSTAKMPLRWRIGTAWLQPRTEHLEVLITEEASSGISRTRPNVRQGRQSLLVRRLTLQPLAIGLTLCVPPRS